MTKTAETTNPNDMIVTMDRRREDRRGNEQAEGQAESKPSSRRKANRRRQIDPTTCERDYSNDEIEFMRAMDDYKRAAGRMFPTCSEILEVLRSIGYVRLTEEQRDILGDSLDDPATSAYVSDEADEEAEFFADAE